MKNGGHSKGNGTTEWFYVLEDWNAPEEAFDWHDYATAYGPFESYEEANQHLIDKHPNPGGHMLDAEPRTELSSVLAELFEDARVERERELNPPHGLGLL